MNLFSSVPVLPAVPVQMRGAAAGWTAMNSDPVFPAACLRLHTSAPSECYTSPAADPWCAHWDMSHIDLSQGLYLFIYL